MRCLRTKGTDTTPDEQWHLGFNGLSLAVILHWGPGKHRRDCATADYLTLSYWSGIVLYVPAPHLASPRPLLRFEPVSPVNPAVLSAQERIRWVPLLSVGWESLLSPEVPLQCQCIHLQPPTRARAASRLCVFHVSCCLFAFINTVVRCPLGWV